MVSLVVLGYSTRESLTPSVNTPLVHKIPDDVTQCLWECKVLLKRWGKITLLTYLQFTGRAEKKAKRQKDRAELHGGESFVKNNFQIFGPCPRPACLDKTSIRKVTTGYETVS